MQKTSSFSGKHLHEKYPRQIFTQIIHISEIYVYMLHMKLRTARLMNIIIYVLGKRPMETAQM